VVEGNDVQFAHLSTAQGLSESAVFNILQDDQGFMWFGTPDGLDRFDGYDFKIYRSGASNGGLSGTTIIGLFKDRSGTLWFGADQFLNRFDPTTETVTQYAPDPKQPASLGGNVYEVTQDQDGQIWLATSNGLDELDPTTGRFTHYRRREGDPNSLDANGAASQVHFVTADRSGILWVETSAGINSFDPKTGQATHFPELRNNAEFQVQNVYQDRSGKLWLYSREGSGLSTFDPATHEFVRYRLLARDPGTPTAERVTSVIQDQHGTIWFGTAGSGVLKYDPTRGVVVRYRNNTADPKSLSNNFVLALCEDREGNIWAGTGGGGVNRFRSSPSAFKVFRKIAGVKNSLDQNFVLSVFEDSYGILWVGNDGVLNRIDPRTGAFRFYRHSSSDPNSISDGTVLSTVEDRDGTLWFATYRGGLNSFDRKTGKFRTLRHAPQNPDSPGSDVIMRLQSDRGGNIWLAADHNLDRFDPSSKRFWHYTSLDEVLANTHVTCLTEDDRGILWLGTWDRGLVRFDPSTQKTNLYTNDPDNPGTLSSNHVNALLVASAGTLWVATQAGLDRFDSATQRFRAYTTQEGLPSSAVQGILQDHNGNLWVSAGKGLAQLNPNTGTIRDYYASDGLAGNDFNYWNAPFQSVRGEMFFPGVDGLTVFDPDRVIGHSSVPPVVLTGLSLFGVPVRANHRPVLQQSISGTQSLTLSHSQSVFSFEFSVLSYTYPEGNRYRHKLQGLEKSWIETDSRHRVAAYTTLAAGNYMLRVQGANSLGIWNEQGVTLHIRILPPWWKAWWFRTLTGLGIGALAFLIYHLRVRALQRLNRVLSYFADIINSSDDAIIAATFTGVITSWNRGAERLYGYAAEEVIGKQIAELVVPKERQKEMLSVLSRIENGEAAIHYETVRLRRNGRPMQVLTTASPIHDERGALTGISVIQRDITDRKQAEDEIRALSERLISAQEQERTRIARELHDDLNQQITGISLALGAAERMFSVSTLEGTKQLEDVRAQLDDLANTIRELSHELHPAILDYGDVSEILRAHCRDFASLNGMEIYFSADGVFEDVPPHIALCVYRIAQEALQNVAKHARTKSAEVRLQRSENLVRLLVSDEGVGFRMDESRFSGGLGLVSIRERVRLVKGTVELHSALSRGTTLKVEVPLTTSLPDIATHSS